MSEQPIDSTKRRVNHDRSGLWAPDPLDEFTSERPASTQPAKPPSVSNARGKRHPAVHRLEPRRGTLALVVPPSSDPVAKDRRGLWSFASGSAFGALVCVMLVSWLMTLEHPQAEPINPSPQPVTTAPPPVTHVAPDPSPADRSIGGVRIDSTPRGARVFIDDKPAGVTPLVVPELEAGSHAVRVDADGYIGWSSTIRVTADRQTRVDTELFPLDLSRH